MKNRIVYILLFLFLASCGDEKDINRENALENQNLFSMARNSVTHKDLDEQLFGLWKSSRFYYFDISYEILWEVTPESTTLALRCQFHEQDPVFVQVEATYEDDLVRALEGFSTFNFPIDEDFKAEDRKKLLSQVEILGAEKYPVERSFSNTRTDSEGNIVQPEFIENQEDPEDKTYLQPIGMTDQRITYYDSETEKEKSLCSLSIDGSQIQSKGLLASGMESWTMDESEEHSDGVIALDIGNIETPVLLRKIQNR